jgi:hypothetical protein
MRVGKPDAIRLRSQHERRLKQLRTRWPDRLLFGDDDDHRRERRSFSASQVRLSIAYLSSNPSVA